MTIPRFMPAPRPTDEHGVLPSSKWPVCPCGSIDALDVETELCRECWRSLMMARLALTQGGFP